MGNKLQGLEHHVFVCHGSKCCKAGASDVMKSLRAEAKDAGVNALFGKTGCQGKCGDCVIVMDYPLGVWYKGVKEKDAKKIVKSMKKQKVWKKKALAIFDGKKFKLKAK